ncbi:MAG TPA: TlpA disulfide reductase family protein [Candidatus Dormibacteraeota bacterium]|nr:TlpA disulfide reductase family protein [Candidatus Dormibacteraeota bacterium]
MFRSRLGIRRHRAAALISVLCLGVVSCQAPWSASSSAPPTSPPPAPAFTLTGLDGQPHVLGDYRGKVVLINFWATWCIPCRAEIPDLEHEARVQDPGKVVILGIDWKEGGPTAQAFLTDIGARYPVLLDSDGKVYDAYGVQGLPQTFIVDRRGRMLSSRTGIASRDQIEKELADALAH